MELSTHLIMPVDHPEAQHIMGCVTRANPEYQEALKRNFSTFNKPQYIREYRVRDGMVYLPRYWQHELEEFTRNQLQDRTTFGEQAGAHFLNSIPINLRKYQNEPVNKVVRELYDKQGATLNALMGTGKTIAALEVIRRMKLKTLILVHTEFLQNQWRDRIKEFLGEEVGIIQEDECDTSHSITIGMMQTLNARNYRHLKDTFGLIVVDEAHRAAAPVFSSVIQQFSARFRMGMTATAERNDGLEWIFYSHIAPPEIIMERSDEFKVEPRVEFVRAPWIGVNTSFFVRRGNFQHSTFLTALGNSSSRNEYIVDMLIEAASKGRNIVVFSDRRKHLTTMAEMFEQGMAKKGLEASYGFMVGGMTEDAREEAQRRQVLFCTYSLAAEGMDVPRLDTAFLTTPKKNVQQAVGRIERALEGKKQPIVVDFVDREFGPARSLADTRLKYYLSRGWQTN